MKLICARRWWEGHEEADLVAAASGARWKFRGYRRGFSIDCPCKMRGHHVIDDDFKGHYPFTYVKR